MIYIKKAFTLIELIVVISIITVISSSGVFYFLDFVKQQEISQKLVIIEDDLKNLDKQIKDYEIYDYELVFDTGSYITYINKFDIPYEQVISLSSGTGTITLTGATSGTGIIRLYKKQKLYLNEERNWNTINELDLSDESYYKINGTFLGEILNEIKLNYYSEDNVLPENNNTLELRRIEDINGNSINNIIIKNIGGNKIIGNNLNEVFLYFDNNGIEKFIKITK